MYTVVMTGPPGTIRATVKVADLAATMDDRLSALREYLERHGVRPAGAPFVRYHTFPDIGPDTKRRAATCTGCGYQAKTYIANFPSWPGMT